VVRVPRAVLIVALALALAAAGCGGKAPGEPVVIWAFGDGGIANGPSRQVVGLVAQDDPDHVIYLGDVYETGSAEEFETFGNVFGDLLMRTWPTPGNHDWPEHAAGYDPFWSDALGRPQPHMYERAAAGWELLSANSETPDDAAQLRRLREGVAGGGSCRIIFWHRPRFNAGRHHDEEAVVARMWDAVKGRAALLLSGHDHDYQRFRPVGGTTQIISGAGGKSHYAVDESDPRLAFSDDTTYGALRIALTPGRADLRYVTTDGDVLDRHTVTCRG
jgi:calcineurin-like phosphoesterase family protein